MDADTLFLVHIAKIARLTVKDFQDELRVNKTTAYAWFNGVKKHPLKRARDCVEMIRRRGELWVIPSVLEYVAGSNFDGAVLTVEQTEALRQLAKAIK
jgi:hypothetical protein